MTDAPILDKEKTEVPAKKTEKKIPDGQKQVHIHAGNKVDVHTQILSELNQSVAVIAKVCALWLKENPPPVKSVPPPPKKDK